MRSHCDDSSSHRSDFSSRTIFEDSCSVRSEIVKSNGARHMGAMVHSGLWVKEGGGEGGGGAERDLERTGYEPFALHSPIQWAL